jgi:hypothetical protein
VVAEKEKSILVDDRFLSHRKVLLLSVIRVLSHFGAENYVTKFESTTFGYIMNLTEKMKSSTLPNHTQQT